MIEIILIIIVCFSLWLFLCWLTAEIVYRIQKRQIQKDLWQKNKPYWDRVNERMKRLTK